MRIIKIDNSAAFVNFTNHTNSSASQGITYTSAKSDTEASIIRNQTVLSPQQSNATSAPSLYSK